jgi:hypothetical protein
LKYLPNLTFASKVSSVTLNPPPPKLSNYGNLTHLAFLFPKCPHQFFFFKKKKPKNIYKYMLGWPNYRIGGGWPSHLAWGGSATPRPLGPNAQKQKFERLV